MSKLAHIQNRNILNTNIQSCITSITVSVCKINNNNINYNNNNNN